MNGSIVSKSIKGAKPVKTLFAVSIVAAIVAIIPATAFGQQIYTYCEVWYDDASNRVYAYASSSPDYSVAYYYNSTITVNLYAGTQHVAGEYGTTSVQTYVSAQPDTDYWAYAEAYVDAYYGYLCECPSPDICYMICPYGASYYYYDAFNFTGVYCNDFRSLMCTGLGPPTFYPYQQYSGGSVSNVIRTPACQYPWGETSQLINWTVLPYGGVPHYGAYFLPQLLDQNGYPPAGKYAGRNVREGFGEATDYCFQWNNGVYELGAPAPSDGIVYQDNSYSIDFLGATADWISYYTQWASGNCFMAVMQVMNISTCSNSASFIPFEYHTNAYGVLAPNQWIYGVQRGSTWGQHAWPW
jgi:hypothetical protein